MKVPLASCSDEELRSLLRRWDRKQSSETVSRMVKNASTILKAGALSRFQSAGCTEWKATCKGTGAGTSYNLKLETQSLSEPGMYEIKVSCTCPFFSSSGTFCKHTIALIVAWQQGQGVEAERKRARSMGKAGKREEEDRKDDEDEETKIREEGKEAERKRARSMGNGGKREDEKEDEEDEEDEEGLDDFFDEWLGPSSQKAPERKEEARKATPPTFTFLDSPVAPKEKKVSVVPVAVADRSEEGEEEKEKEKYSSRKKPKVSFRDKFRKLGYNL